MDDGLWRGMRALDLLRGGVIKVFQLLRPSVLGPDTWNVLPDYPLRKYGKTVIENCGQRYAVGQVTVARAERTARNVIGAKQCA